MVINEQSYQCKLSYDKRMLLIPFSELLVYTLLSHKTLTIDSEWAEVKDVHIVESMGFGGKDKLLKVKLLWLKGIDLPINFPC